MYLSESPRESPAPATGCGNRRSIFAVFYSTRDVFEQDAAQIALARVRQDHDDGFPRVGRFLYQARGSGDCRAAGNAAQDAFLAREASRVVDRFIVVDPFDTVDQRQIQRAGNEPGPDALDLVRAGRARDRRPCSAARAACWRSTANCSRSTSC